MSTTNDLGAEIRRSAAGIEVSGVNLSYGATHVLKDVSLTVNPGNSSPFSALRGAGRRRCCASSPGSTSPRPAR